MGFTLVNAMRSNHGPVRASYLQNQHTMKTLKNTLRSLLMAGTVLVVPFAIAQEGHQKMEKDPEARAEARTEWMTKELGLSAEQAAKIKAIHLQHMTKMQSIKEMQDEDQRKKAMMEVRKSQHSAVQGVLTPAQQDRMRELKAERKAKHEQRKADGHHKGTGGDGTKKEWKEKQ